jgi:hypothetical protein
MFILLIQVFTIAVAMWIGYVFLVAFIKRDLQLFFWIYANRLELFIALIVCFILTILILYYAHLYFIQ